MQLRRLLVSVCLVALSVQLPAADAIAAPGNTPEGRATNWIISQQEADGGFETANFAGFETPDAVMAIAAASQSDDSWSTSEALSAVQSTVNAGKTPLDYLDNLAEGAHGSLSVAKAAELVLICKALGLTPTAFDPQSDGAINLIQTIENGKNPDGSYGPAGAFNATLLAVIARRATGLSVGSSTINVITSSQQSDGGWNFAGDPNESIEDSDTTARAVQALLAAGVARENTSVARGLAWLATHHNSAGAWGFSDTEVNPNSTGLVMLALDVAGFESNASCWRDLHASARVNQPYVSPREGLLSKQTSEGRIASPFDEFGTNTSATSQAVQGLLARRFPHNRLADAPCPEAGYRLVGGDGGVLVYGDAAFNGSLGDTALNAPVVDAARSIRGSGYWLFARDGGVFSFGDAPYHGSLGGMQLNQPVVAAAPTPNGEGYWLFAADGGVFDFGEADFLGSLGDMKLNAPIVAGAATPTGDGYWLFAADGGVFAFGDAAYIDSLGDTALNAPVVSGLATDSGNGYWLFARDGGVFVFGDAYFSGSAGGMKLNQPITDGVRLSVGQGYWLVANDGGVFNFGHARFRGSAGGVALNAPIVSVIA